jgi:hypothetical protein
MSVDWFEVATQRRLSAKVVAVNWKGRCPWVSEFAILRLQENSAQEQAMRQGEIVFNGSARGAMGIAAQP